MFHILERYVWEGNWHGKISFSARHLILARHSCTSAYFVGPSVNLWGLELRSWSRKSHANSERLTSKTVPYFFHVMYWVTFYVDLL